ncbi:MAG: aldo/keto reductase [Acidobacteria bacterium]|nr:aldo/keto reductase [Acidobacteriota bacterium]
MALTDYVTLGRSGLKVSPLCLGAMTFGSDWGWGADVPESEAMISRYLDAGGNFIDTANGYTRGHSEVIIGDLLARTPGLRDRTVLATKFSTNLYPGDPNAGGASRKNIMASCDESLRRLRTDYIDLYWMHFWDPHTPIDETLRALDDLVRAGKVRYIGVSDTPAWKVAQAQVLADMRNWSRFVGLQIEYSLIERTVEGELVPMALELGLGITPWSPLRGGVLTGKYTRENAATASPGRGDRVKAYFTDRTFAIVDTLIRVAGELGTTPAAVAVAWVQARKGVASTIIGARSVAQLDQNLAALDIRLGAEHVSALDAVSTPTLGFPMPFMAFTAMIAQGGTTVNGVPSVPWPMAPQPGQPRY